MSKNITHSLLLLLSDCTILFFLYVSLHLTLNFFLDCVFWLPSLIPGATWMFNIYLLNDSSPEEIFIWVQEQYFNGPS
jgi:hypothetical protein